ncbi:MAG: hypothetical protein H6563_04830 [Lewinellaceae bacterium]|nr:hypothetical protein [Lewinellaceae bacterium]
MISSLRSTYNEKFTIAKYEAMQDWIAKQHNHRPVFRIAETPVFIPDDLMQKVKKACDDVIDVILQPDFKTRTQGALVMDKNVPNEPDHTTFLQMDFGICEDGNGGYTPQLIELQGFPSLYCYQDLAARAFRKFFPIPDDYTHLFNGLTTESYVDLLREVIVGDTPPANVILLELEPHKQTTQIDFWATRDLLGIPVVCITDLKVSGRKVYYEKNGKKISVHKIYNRVIFDELWPRTDLKREFFFPEDYDVEYVGHPNWFFRISKYTLPLIHSPFVPRTWFLDEISTLPDNLSDYVLKPLFSFAGQGVLINPTKEDIESIENPEQFILQKKVHYGSVVKTPNEPAKFELRMMFLWKDHEPRPLLVNNLLRLSKAEMVGVRYNKDKDWVGGSVGFFAKGA